MKRHFLFAALLAALVAGCASPAPIAQTSCPPLVQYTAEEEARAKVELLSLPAGSVIAQMIVDYGKERSILRACSTPAN
jgi:hypothetical protein